MKVLNTHLDEGTFSSGGPVTLHAANVPSLTLGSGECGRLAATPG